MIFLTVGTQSRFDRLVKSVDELIGNNGFDEELFAHIGYSTYKPRNFKAVTYIDKQLFDKYIHDASCIISHAGIQVISMVLQNHKPLLVMPRLKKYGELINDHQVKIAQRFEKLGQILVAYHERDLPKKVNQLKTFVPSGSQ